MVNLFVTKRLTAEVLLLIRTFGNRITATENSITALQSQINTLNLQVQALQESKETTT